MTANLKDGARQKRKIFGETLKSDTICKQCGDQKAMPWTREKSMPSGDKLWPEIL